MRGMLGMEMPVLQAAKSHRGMAKVKQQQQLREPVVLEGVQARGVGSLTGRNGMAEGRKGGIRAQRGKPG